MASLARLTLKKRSWRQHADSFVLPDRQQVFVSRDDQACASFQRAFDDHVVFGIAANAGNAPTNVRAHDFVKILGKHSIKPGIGPIETFG